MIIHLITGEYGVIDGSSKTGCKKRFFDTPRADSGQQYRDYKRTPCITCVDCLKVVERIDNLRRAD